jgi:hypothetical protein
MTMTANLEQRKQYSAPRLTVIGSVERLTFGNGGTKIDGNGSLTAKK